tara:strand:+ start:578 stop:697 length:120 start_codon:yes stop_codon:yes gene_type:complete
MQYDKKIDISSAIINPKKFIASGKIRPGNIVITLNKIIE